MVTWIIDVEAKVIKMNAKVTAVFISSEKAGKPVSMNYVDVLAGLGIEGDRYFSKSGTFSAKGGSGRHVTLIESEAIEAVERDYQISVESGEHRRNIVTLGIALNHLVGKTFTIGGVTLLGVKLCEPCGHLEKLTGKEGIRNAFIHRGGLRADALTDGIISVGDKIVV